MKVEIGYFLLNIFMILKIYMRVCFVIGIENDCSFWFLYIFSEVYLS